MAFCVSSKTGMINRQIKDARYRHQRIVWIQLK
jgi:hypothetical protein